MLTVLSSQEKQSIAAQLADLRRHTRTLSRNLLEYDAVRHSTALEMN